MQSSSSNVNTEIPVANAGPNQQIHSSSEVVLDGTKSYDPNGHSLTYSWIQLAGGQVVELSDASKAKSSFMAPSVSSGTSLTFQLIVNNGIADSSPSIVHVTITP
jgi:hypothetical protein